MDNLEHREITLNVLVLSLSPIGGHSPRASKWADAFLKHGWAVNVASGRDIGRFAIDELAIPVDARIIRKEYRGPFAYRNNPLLRIIQYLTISLKVLASALRTPSDAVLVSHPAFLPIGAMHKLYYRSILLFDGREPLTNPQWQDSLQARSMPILRRAMKLAPIDLCIVTSTNHARDYEQVTGAPCHVVFNAVSDASAPPSAPVSGYGRNFTFLGSLIEGRFLLEAVRSFIEGGSPFDRLKIYGSGPEAVVTPLRRLADADERVTLEGRVPPSQVHGVLVASDIVLVTLDPNDPTAVDLLPNRLFAAISAATPVIAFDGPEMGKIVREFGVGMTYRTEDELRLAISTLSSAPVEDLFTMSEACGAAARDHFSWIRQALPVLTAIEGQAQRRSQK
jgi:glycosyltransferase involved in cell wall biosynthesis